MKRIFIVLTVALVMAATIAAMAAPAFAARGPFVGTKETGKQACTQSQFTIIPSTRSLRALISELGQEEGPGCRSLGPLFTPARSPSF